MDIEGVERLRLEKERWARQEQQDKARAVEEAKQLRDQFAMAALTGLLANSGDVSCSAREGFAKVAYDYADAMLKARGAK